jgi:Tol biopolymer transport system component
VEAYGPTENIPAYPQAISDDGSIMASISPPPLQTNPTPASFSVDMLGITDRWYRPVLTATSVHSLAMTADGRELAIVADGVPASSSSPGGNGLFVFNRSTGKVTKPNQPTGIFSKPSISADGSTIVAGVQSGDFVNQDVLFDLTGGTYTILDTADSPASPVISADGSTVVMGIGLGGGNNSLELYDRATSGATFVGYGAAASVSGDGSRVAYLAQSAYAQPYNLWYWDRSSGQSTQVSTDEVDNQPTISTDGARIEVTDPVFSGFGSILDWNLTTHSEATIAGPAPLDLALASSPNAAHVLYQSLSGGIFRWNRT